ncbi:MAG: cytochrome c3 family protein, partial [Acidobacteria bacterium]|nr:cytochrome c3 family protein [Acidobacteriota bacterium]MDW7983131.1 cytochrome c3 family protein [Acidobacteriota bacterium]
MRYFGSWLIVEVLAFGLTGSLGSGQAQTSDQCWTCHRELLEDTPSQKYVNDVHFQKGIPCAGCHGGDPTQADMDAAMDPKKGYIGVPKGAQVTQTCNACHANESKMAQWASSIDTVQFQQFETSVHGKADVTTCVSCHGAHEIRPARDPQSPTY